MTELVTNEAPQLPTAEMRVAFAVLQPPEDHGPLEARAKLSAHAEIIEDIRDEALPG